MAKSNVEIISTSVVPSLKVDITNVDNLYRDKADIEKAIKTFAKRGAAYVQELMKLTASCMYHYKEYHNSTPMLMLIDAIPEGIRQANFINFLEDFVGVRSTTRIDEKKGRVRTLKRDPAKTFGDAELSKAIAAMKDDPTKYRRPTAARPVPEIRFDLFTQAEKLRSAINKTNEEIKNNTLKTAQVWMPEELVAELTGVLAKIEAAHKQWEADKAIAAAPAPAPTLIPKEVQERKDKARAAKASAAPKGQSALDRAVNKATKGKDTPKAGDAEPPVLNG